MRSMVLMLVLVAVSVPAHAVSRYATQRLSCARIQAILESEGAAIFRYPSPRNSQLTLYDVYAASSRYCPDGEVARPASVPTSDNNRCRVRRCERRQSSGEN